MHTAYGVGWLKDWVQCSVAQLNVLTVIILSFSLLLCVAALFVALTNQWCEACCLSIFMLWIMHLFIHCSIMCPWVHWNLLSYETLTPCTPFIGQHILSSCLTESCSLEFQTTHLENFLDCKNKSWLLYFFSLYYVWTGCNKYVYRILISWWHICVLVCKLVLMARGFTDQQTFHDCERLQLRTVISFDCASVVWK